MDAGLWHAMSRSLEEALLSLDRGAVVELLRRGGDTDDRRTAFCDQVITPTFSRIGVSWEAGDLSLSQVYMASRVLDEAVRALFVDPQLPRGGPVIGIAVLEDFHSLGKKLVEAALRSAGHAVHDLGVGVTCEQLVAGAVEHEVEVLMVSVLMFNKALHVERVATALGDFGEKRPLLVVGGAPFIFDPELWRRVGADACGRTAGDALRIAAAFSRGGP